MEECVAMSEVSKRTLACAQANMNEANEVRMCGEDGSDKNKHHDSVVMVMAGHCA